MTKPLLTSDFDYHLPDELIARHPLDVRSDSRLLHVQGDVLGDLQFSDLPKLLNQGDLLVLNDTKVMKARLFGVKDTGGKIEILLERFIDQIPANTLTDYEMNHKVVGEGVLLQLPNYPNLSLCHIRANKSPTIGQRLLVGAGQPETAMVFGRYRNLFVVGFKNSIPVILDKHGQLPIPPYFERPADSDDDERYQTVFFNPNKERSVAAPTASLHFDHHILQALKNKGINSAFVTLNVGAGTFAPVQTNNISDHQMHQEYAELPQATADKINQTRASGGKIIAVGTTVTRVLESAYLAQVKSGKQNKLSAWAGDTDIFIYPPFEFGVVDRLITNFHLPKSTLLMLVSAFAGTDNIKRAYAHAIAQKYRFFSYGDAMLLDKL